MLLNLYKRVLSIFDFSAYTKNDGVKKHPESPAQDLDSLPKHDDLGQDSQKQGKISMELSNTMPLPQTRSWGF